MCPTKHKNNTKGHTRRSTCVAWLIADDCLVCGIGLQFSWHERAAFNVAEVGIMLKAAWSCAVVVFVTQRATIVIVKSVFMDHKFRVLFENASHRIASFALLCVWHRPRPRPQKALSQCRRAREHVLSPAAIYRTSCKCESQPCVKPCFLFFVPKPEYSQTAISHLITRYSVCLLLSFRNCLCDVQHREMI